MTDHEPLTLRDGIAIVWVAIVCMAFLIPFFLVGMA